jgi:hypothetical protein
MDAPGHEVSRRRDLSVRECGGPGVHGAHRTPQSHRRRLLRAAPEPFLDQPDAVRAGGEACASRAPLGPRSGHGDRARAILAQSPRCLEDSSCDVLENMSRPPVPAASGLTAAPAAPPRQPGRIRRRGRRKRRHTRSRLCRSHRSSSSCVSAARDAIILGGRGHRFSRQEDHLARRWQLATAEPSRAHSSLNSSSRPLGAYMKCVSPRFAHFSPPPTSRHSTHRPDFILRVDRC